MAIKFYSPKKKLIEVRCSDYLAVKLGAVPVERCSDNSDQVHLVVRTRDARILAWPLHPGASTKR